MAYRSHHCSATLRCSVCISVFCTLLVLSVLFPFMLSVPCPFNAPFPFCAFLLLRSASFFTPQSHSNNNPHFFFVQHSYSLCAPCACNLLLALASSPPNLSTSGCFLHFTLPQLSHLLCATLSLSVLHLLLIVSALPDHHGNSSASLAVSPMHPSSLGVISRFLSFSGS
jgi:hypothetical protein